MMEKTDVKTMKLSRTDLIKTCAASLLEEYGDELQAARVELRDARAIFALAVRQFVACRWKDLIASVCKETGGRDNRIEIRPLFEPRLGEDLPNYVSAVVLDGTDYDCNFRLQFSVPMDGPILELAGVILGDLEKVAELESRSTRVADMDAKARAKLIADALDSTSKGREALAALAAMRKAL